MSYRYDDRLVLRVTGKRSLRQDKTEEGGHVKIEGEMRHDQEANVTFLILDRLPRAAHT